LSNEIANHPSEKFMALLSRLLFQPDDTTAQARLQSEITSISREDFDELVNSPQRLQSL
jgi:hypothetical protein